MITLDQALASYAENLSPLPAHPMDLEDCIGRVLVEPQHSEIDLPRFDQSAMDGYALRAAEANATLHVAGVAACGDAPPKLAAESACRIYTGAAIPQGADCVVPQENTQVENSQLTCTQTPEAGAHIRRLGEELREGDLVADAKLRVHPGLAAALAMAGLARVNVHRQPRIAVLVTGDEVRPPGAVLNEYQIPDANGPLIKLMLASWGYAGVEPEYVQDTENAVTGRMKAALESADLVITTGGASVGDRDFVPKVSEALGMQQVFWKVAQKPGKPTLFAVNKQSALVALPGNPAAVLIGMLLHVRTALNCLEGLADPLPQWHTGILQQDYATDARERLIRVRATTNDDGQNCLAALPKQASHMLSNMAQANALARLPANSECKAGQVVSWLDI